MEENNGKTNYLIYIIILIVLLIIATIAITFAYYKGNNDYGKTLVDVSSSLDCIDLNLSSSGNNLSLSYNYPITDELAETSGSITPVTVSVTNNCSSSRNYTLALSTLFLTNSTTSYIEDSKIRFKVVKNDSVYKNASYLDSLKKVSTTNQAYKDLIGDDGELKSKYPDYTVNKIYAIDSIETIQPNSTNTYSIYLWLDYYEGDSNMYMDADAIHDESYDNTTAGKKFAAAISLSLNATSEEEKTVYAQVVSDYTNGNGVALLSDSDKGSRDYDTYYYTGNITNNNVLYGDFCWKMVITTEGNGVKMIYNGEPSNGSCNNTGDDSTIGKSAFNSNYDSPAYVGYMYNKAYTTTKKSIPSSDTTEYIYGNSVSWNGSNYTLEDIKRGVWSSVYNSLDSNHYTCLNESGTCSSVYYIDYATSSYVYYLTLTGGVKINEALDEMLYNDDVNTTDSTVKTYIDSWYENNLLNREDSEGNLYSSYLQNTIYCNNRETTSLGGFNPNGGSTTTDINFNYKSLDCANKNDQFTLRVDAGGTEEYGNNALKYPIGLLNYKEADLVTMNGSNTNYLNNNSYYWILSPYRFYRNYALGCYLYGGAFNYYGVFNSPGVRPAVTLSSSVEIKDGDGSVDNPYIVGLA